MTSKYSFNESLMEKMVNMMVNNKTFYKNPVVSVQNEHGVNIELCINVDRDLDYSTKSIDLQSFKSKVRLTLFINYPVWSGGSMRCREYREDIIKDVGEFIINIEKCNHCNEFNNLISFDLYEYGIDEDIRCCQQCASEFLIPKSIKNEKCSICLDPLQVFYITTKCNHNFHKRCFIKISSTWKNGVKCRKCPLCRSLTKIFK
jgi:hypothetical protein